MVTLLGPWCHSNPCVILTLDFPTPRNLFPQEYFKEGNYNKIKINRLRPLDEESSALIEWLERGVFDALQKEYVSFPLISCLLAVSNPFLNP